MMHPDQKHYDADELVRGLPAHLPAGEDLLWQGSPSWKTFAVRFCRIQWIAAYFVALAAWFAVSSLYAGESLDDLVMPEMRVAGIAALFLTLTVVFSYAIEKTTVYTVTSRRVMIRAGVALPKTVNLPFARLNGASAELFTTGHGDIELMPMADERIAYFMMWPHLRGFSVSRGIPVMRSIPRARHAAAILGDAMSRFVETESPSVATAPAASTTRAPSRPAQAGGMTAAA
jgi:hypothetical protein